MNKNSKKEIEMEYKYGHHIPEVERSARAVHRALNAIIVNQMFAALANGNEIEKQLKVFRRDFEDVMKTVTKGTGVKDDEDFYNVSRRMKSIARQCNKAVKAAYVCLRHEVQEKKHCIPVSDSQAEPQSAQSMLLTELEKAKKLKKEFSKAVHKLKPSALKLGVHAVWRGLNATGRALMLILDEAEKMQKTQSESDDMEHPASKKEKEQFWLSSLLANKKLWDFVKKLIGKGK